MSRESEGKEKGGIIDEPRSKGINLRNFKAAKNDGRRGKSLLFDL